MNGILVIVLVVIAIVSVAKLLGMLDKEQYFFHLIATSIAGALCFILSLFNFSAWDYELWNGEVSKIEAIQKDCPVGWKTSKDSFCTEYRTREVYDGRTCTGSGKDQVCVDNYHTEYEYRYDWERRYFVLSENISEEWEIDRVDPQGTIYPPLFKQTKIGDPVSKTNRYNNWVKAASESIFNEDGTTEEKYLEVIPQYPMEIYDYFKVDRIVTVGNVKVVDIEKHNRLLSDALKTLGPKRQMNAVIVIADASVAGPDFPFAVRRAWKGFKKNDAVIFIGLRDGNIEWTEVLSWSKKSTFDIELRDKIIQNVNKPLDLVSTIGYLKDIGMQSYERRSMKEFEFLKDEISTPIWVYVVTIAILLIANAIAFFAMMHTRKVNSYGYR